MDPTIVTPHFLSFTLFAMYTFAFSTDFSAVPVIFLIDYSLASIQTICLLTFVALYPKTFNVVIVLIKGLYVLLVCNFLIMSVLWFTSTAVLSADLLKFYITRLILACIELLLVLKFSLPQPHPPTKPMSKPPSYSTFAPLHETI